MGSITIKNRLGSVTVEPPDRDGEIEIRVQVHARSLCYYATPAEAIELAEALTTIAAETVKQRTT